MPRATYRQFSLDPSAAAELRALRGLVASIGVSNLPEDLRGAIEGAGDGRATFSDVVRLAVRALVERLSGERPEAKLVRTSTTKEVRAFQEAWNDPPTRPHGVVGRKTARAAAKALRGRPR